MKQTTPFDVALEVGQGNPGALSVLGGLIAAGRVDIVEAMRSLGITGPRVWIAAKDIHKGDVPALIAGVEDRSILAKLAALGYAPEGYKPESAQ